MVALARKASPCLVLYLWMHRRPICGGVAPLQHGANWRSLLRRRLKTNTADEFSLLPQWLAAGMTDYVAIITRFDPEGVIGEMDAVYSSWGTRAPEDSTMAKSPRLSISCRPSRLPSNQYRSRV